MRLKIGWRLCQAIIVMLVCSVTAVANGKDTNKVDRNPQASNTVLTSNATLNAKIQTGVVSVQFFDEPSSFEKAVINAKLQQMGYPNDYISNQHWSTKAFRAHNEIQYGGEQSNHEHRLDSGIGVLTLDPSYIKLDFTVTDQSSVTQNGFRLETDWDWNQSPFWTLTDKVGWAWVNVVRGRTSAGQTRTFGAATAYFHKQASCNGTLSYAYPVAPGISTTCTWAYDKSSEPTVTRLY